MTGAAIAGLAMAGVATAVGGVTAYYNNKAQAEATEAQAAAVKQQAEAEIAANNTQAAQVQAQAEQDAAQRSRQLARDLSDSYAQYAGNGLAVDAGGSSDTLGRILSTQRQEGEADINTIRANAKSNLWSITQSSQSTAESANMQIKQLDMQRDEYLRQGNLGLWQTFTGLPLTSNNGWSSAAGIVSSKQSYAEGSVMTQKFSLNS